MAEVCHHIKGLRMRKISTLNFTGQPFQITDLVPSRRTYLEPDFTRGINEKRARSSSQKF